MIHDEADTAIDEAENLEELAELAGKKEPARVKPADMPGEVFVVPLSRRPFFPGMAAPIVIEPGAFYEVLKTVAKTEHKSMGLFLTKNEEINIYKAGFDDLYSVGILARILRIIPMEQGGAQVVLNTRSGSMRPRKVSIRARGCSKISFFMKCL